jgi:hypothetical protein
MDVILLRSNKRHISAIQDDENNNKGKDKIHPVTSHEGPEGGGGVEV